jgi:enamine deaminase RidA (YjgF/YER057c/UK114 family)
MPETQRRRAGGRQPQLKKANPPMSRIIRTEPSPILSKAVEYHGFVFTQGMVTRDPSLDIKGQVRDVLAQIDEVLETHGTDNTRILQAQIWLKQIGDRAALNEIWSAWLPEGQAPARAVVQAELADPRWLVEIMITTCK